MRQNMFGPFDEEELGDISRNVKKVILITEKHDTLCSITHFK